MKLIELQEILGQGIKDITNKESSPREHEKALENAEYIAKLAKQMINNADVILRTDKLLAEGKALSNAEQLIRDGK